MKKCITVICLVFSIVLVFVGCETGTTISGTKAESQKTLAIGNKLADNQPTPTDIEFSVTRYSLIRRAYILNGLPDKADSLPCPVDLPLVYVGCYLEGVGLVRTFAIEGYPVSLNTFLSPDSEYYEKDLDFAGSLTGQQVDRYSNKWMPDVDGTFGQNENGVFFFTVDGEMKEWLGPIETSQTPFDEVQ